MRIEFLLFRTPVDDKVREIFLEHIPSVMENIPFNFIQENLEQHEKQLQGEPDKSSSDLQEEKSEDFALPNESESVDTEVVDSQKENELSTDKYAPINSAYEDMNEEGEVDSEIMEHEPPYQKSKSQKSKRNYS
jgi:signal-transduction protein with cAMP-binding, CBS, and nucleotidyltransferase domain